MAARILLVNPPIYDFSAVFPILSLGASEVDRVKDLCHRLNEKQKTGTHLRMAGTSTVNHLGRTFLFK